MLDQKNQSRVYAIENAQFVPYIFCVDGFLVPHSTSEGAEVIFIFQILKNSKRQENNQNRRKPFITVTPRC